MVKTLTIYTLCIQFVEIIIWDCYVFPKPSVLDRIQYHFSFEEEYSWFEFCFPSRLVNKLSLKIQAVYSTIYSYVKLTKYINVGINLNLH